MCSSSLAISGQVALSLLEGKTRGLTLVIFPIVGSGKFQSERVRFQVPMIGVSHVTCLDRTLPLKTLVVSEKCVLPRNMGRSDQSLTLATQELESIFFFPLLAQLAWYGGFWAACQATEQYLSLEIGHTHYSRQGWHVWASHYKSYVRIKVLAGLATVGWLLPRHSLNCPQLDNFWNKERIFQREIVTTIVGSTGQKWATRGILEGFCKSEGSCLLYFTILT